MNWIVRSSTGLRGAVNVPGDKSISHRALMHAALAHGTSRITNFLQAGVTEAMLRCVRDLGVKVETSAQGEISVQGGRVRSPVAMLDCGNSGATIRMLMGALAGQSTVTSTLTGSA